MIKPYAISGIRLPNDYVEPGIGDPDYAPAPVRTFVITDQIRAADAALQAAREAGKSSDWAIKSELSEANLRLSKQRHVPGRQLGRRTLLADAKSARRICPTCPRALNSRSKGTHCLRCAKRIVREARELQRTAAREELQAARKARICATVDCENELHGNNRTPLCGGCNRAARETPVVNTSPATCSDGCGASLRIGKARRADNRCGQCGQNADARKQRSQQPAASSQQPAASSQQPAASSQQPAASSQQVSIAAPVASTPDAASREEDELDALWQSLSLADKWAVLEEVMNA